MYDFKSLSDFDFELLVRDLLQVELGITLESFKKGKDKGIDLRFAQDPNKSLIVQCKHYARSKFSDLKRELGKEVDKVKALSPKKYLVATSLELSPANKDDILKLFTPYCQGTQDIYSGNDLNNLLTKEQFANTLRQHYKLWLTNTEVLDQIIHSSTTNETRFLVESIKAKAPKYVQNQSYQESLDVLAQHNYCIISGSPGIGKTFLAEILLLKFMKDG